MVVHGNVDLQKVATVTLNIPGSVDLNLLDKFLQELLWEKSITDSAGHVMDVYRVKVGHPLTSSHRGHTDRSVGYSMRNAYLT